MALAIRVALSLLILTIALHGQANAQNESLVPIPEQWDGFTIPSSEPSGGPVAEMARTPATPTPAPLPYVEEPSAPPAPVPAPYTTESPASAATPEAACPELIEACDGPRWTVYSDALFLHRSRSDRAALVTDSFAPGGNVLLNGADFSFDTEAGFRVGLIRHNVLGTAWDLEGLYFGIDGWKGTMGPVYSANGAATQFVNPLGNTVTPADVWASYRSELHNVEVNGRRPIRDWLSVLAGFRYLELNEGLTMFQDIGPGTNLARVAVDATNHLAGFQLGLDGRVWNRGRLELDCVLKAGIYANDAENDVRITQTASLPPLGSAASENHTAFVGEIGLTGVYRLSRGWAIRGGYQLLWIEGVALASDQVAVSDPDNGLATVDTSGSPFYHGAFVGLEFRR